MSYRVAFLKAGKLQPVWSWLFLWPRQGPSARSVPTPAPVPASAALFRWELQMLGSVSIPCGCCLLNSHSRFSSLKTGASVFLSLSQVWQEGWFRQWSECPRLPGSCLQSDLTISWCPGVGLLFIWGLPEAGNCKSCRITLKIRCGRKEML